MKYCFSLNLNEARLSMLRKEEGSIFQARGPVKDTLRSVCESLWKGGQANSRFLVF